MMIQFWVSIQLMIEMKALWGDGLSKPLIGLGICTRESIK